MASSVAPIRPRVKQRAGDRIFAGATRVAGLLILVALAGVAIFLTLEGLPALNAEPADLFGASSFLAFVWPLLFGLGSIHMAHTADEFLSIDELKAAVNHYVTIAKSLMG